MPTSRTTNLTHRAQDEAQSDYLGARLQPSRRNFGKQMLFAGAGLLLPWQVLARERQIHILRGNVKINGVKATQDSSINPGDVVTAGADGYIVFVAGTSAFMLRSRSEVLIEAPKAKTDFGFGFLKLVSGALGATFRTGTPVRLRTLNATIGIRGTGVYMETRGEGTYFCTCWGKTELNVNDAPMQREWIESTRHNPRLIGYKPDANGAYVLAAPFETHTDDEMDMLEECVGRRAPWVKKSR